VIESALIMFLVVLGMLGLGYLSVRARRADEAWAHGELSAEAARAWRDVLEELVGTVPGGSVVDAGDGSPARAVWAVGEAALVVRTEPASDHGATRWFIAVSLGRLRLDVSARAAGADAGPGARWRSGDAALDAAVALRGSPRRLQLAVAEPVRSALIGLIEAGASLSAGVWVWRAPADAVEAEDVERAVRWMRDVAGFGAR
jgi:hypothetical protein